MESDPEIEQGHRGSFFLTEGTSPQGAEAQEVPSSGPVSTASEDSVLQELLSFQPSGQDHPMQAEEAGEPALSALGGALRSARGLVDAPLSPAGGAP